MRPGVIETFASLMLKGAEPATMRFPLPTAPPESLNWMPEPFGTMQMLLLICQTVFVVAAITMAGPAPDPTPTTRLLLKVIVEPPPVVGKLIALLPEAP
jgi:hypothetical protein